VRKSHKFNAETKDLTAEVESKTVPKAEDTSNSQTNGAFVGAEDDDEDLGLRARALYDYQAG